MWKPLRALPPYLGGKRRLLGHIFKHVPKPADAPVFVDAFLGGGSVSLYAKARGYRVVCNDIALRSQIVIELGRSRNPGALDILTEVYRNDPDFPARHIVIKAFGDLQKDLPLPEAREILLEALQKETSDGARAHAARGLEDPAPGDAERAILRDVVLSDSCENVRLAALGVLARAGGEEMFLRTLIELDGAPLRVKALAARGLERTR